jgi:hypothetical protein
LASLDECSVNEMVAVVMHPACVECATTTIDEKHMTYPGKTSASQLALLGQVERVMALSAYRQRTM